MENCNWTDCSERGQKKCSGCQAVFYCSQQHQKLDWKIHKPKCLNWEIQHVKGEGHCLIANKFIQTGTLLLVEEPLIVFRDLKLAEKDLCQILLLAGAYSYPCVGCGYGHLDVKDPHFCSKCSIPLCNKSCESNILHSNQECAALEQIGMQNFRSSKQGANVSQDVFILRVLIQMNKSDGLRKSISRMIQDERIRKISSSKGFNVDGAEIIDNLPEELDDDIEYLFPFSYKYCQNDNLIRSISCAINFFSCRVDTSNRERAVFTTRIHLSHSCVPNAEMWIDSSLGYYKLCVRAKCLIKPLEKITVCVDDRLLCLPTLERRVILKDVHQIDCKCRRCVDPTECKLFVSGVRCTFSKCQGGYLVPKSPLEEFSDWKCHLKNCKSTVRHREMRERIWKLEQELNVCGEIEDKSYSYFDKFLEVNKDVLHPNHFLMQKAVSNIGKIANYFLGSGARLVLCVVSDFKHARQLCERKNEYIQSLLHLHNKYKFGLKEDSGKLNCELACGCLALELLKFKDDPRQVGSDNLKEKTKDLKRAYDLFKDAVGLLSKYVTCEGDSTQDWINDALTLGNIMLNCMRPVFYPPKEATASSGMQAATNLIKKLIEILVEIAAEVDLLKEYTNPKCPVYLGGKTLLEIITEKTKNLCSSSN